MPGISPDIISHRLSVNPAIRPVRQKRRAYDPERYEAMRAEVDRLSSIRFIREVDYPTWLANIVMVRSIRFGASIPLTPLSEKSSRILANTLKLLHIQLTSQPTLISHRIICLRFSF
ncbi:hypothetical protein L3X38_024365 [Prunus dulcis]|uniref:Uncharacterized protein n=1 Tax=Prunus dulcis TaxID=3755 RepID=A0AAD4W2E1_PRUDU|nr:hypothetical protein L3X38_024365 [Prunus dulcis]